MVPIFILYKLIINIFHNRSFSCLIFILFLSYNYSSDDSLYGEGFKNLDFW